MRALPLRARWARVMTQTNHSTHQNRLLGAMSQADTDEFFSDLHPVDLVLKQVVYEVGAPLEYVYFMRQGVASIITKMANGDTIEAGMIGLEGMVGLSALFGDETSGQHVLVQAPGTALRMSVANCIAAFDQSVGVRKVILRYTAALLSVGTRTAGCNSLHSLQQRTARWLLMMHDRLQSETMPLTQEFLSTMLGVHRTRITDAAGTLQRLGLIRYARGLVTVLDHPGLSAIACECYRDHDRLLN
jgi:CRP-like cAMP-binding protein